MIQNLKELIGSKNAFKVPNTYFDSLENNILATLKAKKLYEHSQSEVPNNYFNTLEDTIVQKLEHKPKVISFRSRLMKRIIPVSVAASLLLFVSLNFFNTEKNSFDTIASAEIEAYIDTEFAELSSEDIANVFEETNIDSESFEASVNKEEIMNYLENTTIENYIYEN